MEIQSYNAELAIANLMFQRIFNNIRIQRLQKNNIKKDIKVTCVFGQRSRIYKNWENAEKRSILKLPMIVINRTGYTRNPERLNNLHNEIKYELGSNARIYDLCTPIPIDISYDVSIISKYPSDIDQIASNFMVFFNNDIFVTCEHPKYENIKFNNQVIMSDSISEEHPDELDETADDLITSTFQFTFKTHLFAGRHKVNSKGQVIPSPGLDEPIKPTNPNNPVDPDNPTDTDSGDHDGFIPIIKKINLGVYPVPKNVEYIPGYISYIDKRLEDPDDLKPVEKNYVDRIVWVIDEFSDKKFPNNIKHQDNIFKKIKIFLKNNAKNNRKNNN